MPLVVRLRSAVCLLGRFPALAGVDLDVAAGEIVLLSGANGAGQDHAAAAARRPGAAVLGRGRRCSATTSPSTARGARRDLALVGHETFCYDDLTVRENLRFAARAAGRRRRRRRRRARAARARPPGRRRAPAASRPGSAAASRSRWRSSRDPRLLLLDEPHAGLDAEGRAVLDEIVRRRAGRGPHGAASPRTSSTTPAPLGDPRGRAHRRPGPPRAAAGPVPGDVAASTGRGAGVNLLAEVAAGRGQGPADRGPVAGDRASRSCRSG